MRKAVKVTGILLCLVLLASIVVLPAAAISSAPYKGYSYNPYGETISAPIGYEPDRTIDSVDMQLKTPLSNPSDLFYYGEKIYIADTDNNRIVVLDKNYKFVSEFTYFKGSDGKKYPITKPQGVYLKNDELFVCLEISKDGNYVGYVITADLKGNVMRMFTNPSDQSTVVDEENFRPRQVVVDDSGYVYVRCQDILDGMLVYNSEGEFLMFYGANQVTMTWYLIAQQFWKKVLSQEAASTLIKAVPTEMSNVFIDKDGFIYTTTSVVSIAEKLRLRKLNAVGQNILLGDENELNQPAYGDRGLKESTEDVTTLVDVFVDDNDIIATLDQQYGRVFIYNQTSNLLTIFGNRATDNLVRNGETAFPVALSKIDDKYLILDKGESTIVTFKPTDYMSMLYEADEYYLKGLYVESEKYWRNVLQYDANCTRAYAAIGKSLLEQDKYEESLKYLKMGEDRTSYSLALAEYRKEYLRRNWYWLLPVTVLVLVLFTMLIRFIQKCLGVKHKATKMKFQ